MSSPAAPDGEVLVDDTAGVDLLGTCRPMADGASDPTWRFGADRVVRAMSTPEGPVTVQLCRSVDGVRATTWGPGSDWFLARVGRFVGPPTPERLPFGRCTRWSTGCTAVIRGCGSARACACATCSCRRSWANG